MQRVNVWSEGERFITFYDVEDAFYWCMKTLGTPGAGARWQYGKSAPDFTGSTFISSPMEIDYFEFANDEDLLAFRLAF